MNALVPATILAGGRSSRLGGGDKCLLPLGGASILAHIVAALSGQAGEILINSNSDPRLFAETALAVRCDMTPGRLGPLAGILTAMLWARELGALHVLTVPADTPFLPHDLATRLIAARADDGPAIAAYGDALHPTIGLWPTTLAARLRDDLESGVRRVRGWLSDIAFSVARFDVHQHDPFWNINTRYEWEQARARLHQT